MQRVNMATILAISTAVACVEPAPVPPQPTCGVEQGASAGQALEAILVITPVVDIVLGEALGGDVCTANADFPGAADCQQVLDASCLGELDAVVDEATTATVSLRAQQQQISITSVVVESDCGWSLDDESGFNIDPGTEVPLTIGFIGETAGTCDGRLLITTATSEGTPIAITLKATTELTASSSSCYRRRWL